MSKPRKPPKLSAVEYIEWEDHVSLAESGWKDKRDAHELSPEICKSVGFVLRETSKHVVLVSSVSGHQIDGEVCILKNCIIARKTMDAS